MYNYILQIIIYERYNLIYNNLIYNNLIYNNLIYNNLFIFDCKSCKLGFGKLS